MDKVFFESKDNRIAGLLNKPAGNVSTAVIRMHGYRSDKEGNTSKALTNVFKNNLFLTFDFHGHGESEGIIETDVLDYVEDLMNAIAFVKKFKVNKIALTGSSLGGLIAILGAAWNKDVSAAVAVCPVSDIAVMKNTSIRFEQFIEKIKATNVYIEAEKIKVPFCVIHGDEDEVVPVNHSVKLVDHIEKGLLHIVQGADHRFSQGAHFNEMIMQTKRFICQNIPSHR